MPKQGGSDVSIRAPITGNHVRRGETRKDHASDTVNGWSTRSQTRTRQCLPEDTVVADKVKSTNNLKLVGYKTNNESHVNQTVKLVDVCFHNRSHTPSKL
jgi:hypothetical protein